MHPVRASGVQASVVHGSGPRLPPPPYTEDVAAEAAVVEVAAEIVAVVAAAAEAAARALRLRQDWSMFAPEPPRDGGRVAVVVNDFDGGDTYRSSNWGVGWWMPSDSNSYGGGIPPAFLRAHVRALLRAIVTYEPFNSRGAYCARSSS